MFTLDETKTLMQLYTQLHSLNMEYKALEIEEQVFIVDREVMKQKKMVVEEDINNTLKKIESVGE